MLVNKTSNNEDNDKNDQSENNIFEVEKENLIKEDDNKEKEIRNETKKVIMPVDVHSQESYEIVDKENNEKKSINPISQYKSPPKVEALIPLPPKPKYSFLRKWLLSSQF